MDYFDSETIEKVMRDLDELEEGLASSAKVALSRVFKKSPKAGKNSLNRVKNSVKSKELASSSYVVPSTRRRPVPVSKPGAKPPASTGSVTAKKKFKNPQEMAKYMASNKSDPLWKSDKARAVYKKHGPLAASEVYFDWLVESSKKWMQDAVKRPGAFKQKAKDHNMTTQRFASYVKQNPDKFDTRTKRQANLAQTFLKYSKKS